LEIKALEIKAWASWKLEAGDADGFEDRRAQEQFSGARSSFLLFLASNVQSLVSANSEVGG
jgi:hypothetical protein